MGPLLLLGLFGGLFADLFDRRLLLIALQIEQAVFSLVLAAIVGIGGEPSRWALFACVFAIGIGNALNLPAWSAVLPSLVGRADLPGAISLNSTQVNLSRVIGPAIAGVLYPIAGPSWIFVFNAATYVFVVGRAALGPLPGRAAQPPTRAGTTSCSACAWHAATRWSERILVTLPIFSFFCLPFIGLFPAIAASDLDLDTDTFAYGALYASFGVGAAIGALSIGTVLAGTDKAKLARVGLAGFAVAVFVFGLLRSPAIAYGVVLVLGAVYFGTVTAMMTVLQETLADEVRGRVMALWFMAFGGTVPLGALVFGPLLDATSSTVLLSIAGGVRARPGVVVRPAGRHGPITPNGGGLSAARLRGCPHSGVRRPGRRWPDLACSRCTDGGGHHRLRRDARRPRRPRPRPARLRRHAAARTAGGGRLRAAVAPVLDACAPGVVVVGHSFGGRVAVHLARRRPGTSPPSCSPACPARASRAGEPAASFRIAQAHGKGS